MQHSPHLQLFTLSPLLSQKHKYNKIQLVIQKFRLVIALKNRQPASALGARGNGYAQSYPQPVAARAGTILACPPLRFSHRRA
jgi:hypothetical protein